MKEQQQLLKNLFKFHFIFMLTLGYAWQVRTEITFTSQILLRVSVEEQIRRWNKRIDWKNFYILIVTAKEMHYFSALFW